MVQSMSTSNSPSPVHSFLCMDLLYSLDESVDTSSITSSSPEICFPAVVALATVPSSKQTLSPSNLFYLPAFLPLSYTHTYTYTLPLSHTHTLTISYTFSHPHSLFSSPIYSFKPHFPSTSSATCSSPTHTLPNTRCTHLAAVSPTPSIYYTLPHSPSCISTSSFSSTFNISHIHTLPNSLHHSFLIYTLSHFLHHFFLLLTHLTYN